MTFIKKFVYLLLSLFCFILLSACQNNSWNDPQSNQNQTKVVYYSSFSQSPKTLDPARSYSTNETVFTAQIYEPPLQYHYLKRPYTLVPLTAQSVPKPVYLDKNNHVLPENAKTEEIVYSVYDIAIKPGIFYQPHPAFAKDKNGHYYYHHSAAGDFAGIYSIKDFKHSGTRELIAADYVYEIKRIADPKVQSPIFGLMSGYILGFSDFAKSLESIYLKLPRGESKFLNLNNYDLAGVKILDRYHYRVILKGQYPQFIFWLAMPFFAPMPWEVDYFYFQPGMAENNITLAWYPVGTGPYMLMENNPNSKMVLIKNPNFHKELYPSEGSSADVAKGLLKNAGKPLPFIDALVLSLEKESIPRWTKFLQGYYDQSTIGSDNFDQVIQIDTTGHPYLTPSMQLKKLRLQTSVSPGVFYVGFNMLDDVVGGYSERAKKLRQAISIAINFESFISIFLNGRGMIAQSPLPQGIFGFQKGEAGIDPYVYYWKNGMAIRKSIAAARHLLAEAGYPNGRNAKTGQALILNFDVSIGGGAEDKAEFEWLRQQFAKLGIELQIRATQYNRFQEKMRAGNTQIYMWGWTADYPDPENFLFLLYGPNGKVKKGGENASNYVNPEFDKLFNQMKDMPNNAEREAIIKHMIAIVQRDAPWVWGYYPEDFVLAQQWVGVYKPSGVTANTLKYISLNPKLRAKMQREWNKPVLWPLFLAILLMFIIIIPVIIQYWRKEHKPIEKIKEWDI
jgi:ABC-type transport system substrate-binding protein